MVDAITTTSPAITTQTANSSATSTAALTSDFETFLTMLTVQVQNLSLIHI